MKDVLWNILSHYLSAFLCFKYLGWSLEPVFMPFWELLSIKPLWQNPLGYRIWVRGHTLHPVLWQMFLLFGLCLSVGKVGYLKYPQGDIVVLLISCNRQKTFSDFHCFSSKVEWAVMGFFGLFFKKVQNEGDLLHLNWKQNVRWNQSRFVKVCVGDGRFCVFLKCAVGRAFLLH